MRAPTRRRTFVAAACALALSGAMVRDVRGQTTPDGASAAPDFSATADETQAWELYQQNRLVAAREKAEAILRAQSALPTEQRSAVAYYVLGVVLHDAEGDLGRAMFYLGTARYIYENQWRPGPGNEHPPGAPWQLHREILFATQQLAGEMEEYDYQLQLLEFYDSLYDPDLSAEHAWPLLHEHRYDEARAFAQRAINSGDDGEKSLGLNAMCAIETEAHKRQAGYEACLAALADAQAHPSSPLAVHAYNAALAASGVLRQDEVERLARIGTQHVEATPANPWRLLTLLYIDEGRTGEALEAARAMHRWRVQQPASLGDQDHAETDATIATLMLAIGAGEEGMRFIDRALERPDRRGLTSSGPEQALGANALTRRALHLLAAEEWDEQASWSHGTEALRCHWKAEQHRLAAWPDAQRVDSVLSDEARLDATLRVYLRGGIEPVGVWLLGDLVDVLGPGVVSVALSQARSEERATPGLSAYYDAIGADVAYAQGDDAAAVRLAQSALQHLPQGEALLQARAAAVGGMAACRDGNAQLCAGLYERAIQKDPGALRRVGAVIPAQVRVTGSGPVLDAAADLLRGSPRIREASGGFTIQVDAEGGAPRACLLSATGNRLGCATAPPLHDNPHESASDQASRLASNFHREVFSAQVNVSQMDLNSLDSSGTAAGETARDRLNGVLQDISGDNP